MPVIVDVKVPSKVTTSVLAESTKTSSTITVGRQGPPGAGFINVDSDTGWGLTKPIRPVTSGTYDLGSTSYPFGSFYTQNGNFYGNLNVQGDVSITGSLGLSGNFTIGDDTTDSITTRGDLFVADDAFFSDDVNITGNLTTRNVYPEATTTYDLGSSTKKWNNIHAKTVHVDGSTLMMGADGAQVKVVGNRLQFQGNTASDGAYFVGDTYINAGTFFAQKAFGPQFQILNTNSTNRYEFELDDNGHLNITGNLNGNVKFSNDILPASNGANIGNGSSKWNYLHSVTGYIDKLSVGTTDTGKTLNVGGDAKIFGDVDIYDENNTTNKIVAIYDTVDEGKIDIKNANSTTIRFASNSNSYFLNGNLGLGTSTPSVKLDINSNDAIKIPVGTTAQRPAASDGMIRLNTTASQFEGYHGGNWQGLGGVIDVDQDTYVSTEKTADDDALYFYTAGSERARVADNGNFSIANDLTVSGDLSVSGNFNLGDSTTDRITTQGDLYVKDDAFFSDSVTVTGDLTSRNIYPAASGQYDLGSESLKWDNIYSKTGNFDGGTINLGVGGARIITSADGSVNMVGDNGVVAEGLKPSPSIKGNVYVETGAYITGSLNVGADATISGSILTDGTVTASTPTQNGHLTTKFYVDSADNTLTTNLATTGSNLEAQIVNNDADVSALQTATGSLQTQVSSNDTDIATINTKITDISGDAVYTTGTQTVAGSKTFSDNTVFSSGVTVLGALGVSGNFTLGDDATDSITTRGDLFVEDDAVFSDDMTVTGNARFVGNVGIGVGSATPSATLELGSSAAAIRNIRYKDTAGSPTKYNFELAAQRVDQSWTVTPSTLPGGSSFSNPALTVNSDGNVGVGTTPSKKFQVESSSNQIKITDTGQSGSGNRHAIFNFSDSGDNSLDILTAYAAGAANKITLSPAGSTVMTLLQGGKVGIGVSVPTQALHIDGSLRLTGAIYDTNNSAGTNGQILISTGSAIDWKSLSEITGVDGTGTANYIPKWSDTDSIGNSIIYDDGTKVGIGTAAPSRLLTLENNTGTVINQSQLRINNAGAGDSYIYMYAGADWSFGIDNSDGDKFKFNISNDVSDGTEVLTLQRDGKVGIGTTTPSAQLQTSGDVIVGGNLTVSGTTFTVDTSNVLVEDPVLLLAKNQTGGAALDSGFIVERGSDQNVGFIWDESSDHFTFINTNEIADDNDITIASYANIKAANAIVADLTSSNGYFDWTRNSTGVAAKITQSGTGDILNLFDGATNVFSILDGGNAKAIGNFAIGGGDPVATKGLYILQDGGTVTTNSYGLDIKNTEASATANKSKYGLYVENSGTHWTGTSSKSYGIRVLNKEGTNGGGYSTETFGAFIETVANAPAGKNWGLYVTGEDKSYFSGKVGIGTTDPGSAYKLRVEGATFINGSIFVPNSTNYFGALDSSGSYKIIASMDSSNVIQFGHVGQNNAINVSASYIALSARDALGIARETLRVIGPTGVGGVGNVGIGTTTPSVSLDISSTNAIKIPVGTTAQRPTAANGMMRLNTTTNQFEGYNNSVWQGLGGVIDVDQDTYVSTEKTSDDDTLFFYTAGGERAKIDNAGNTFVAGDLTISGSLAVSGDFTLGDTTTDKITTRGDLYVEDDAFFADAVEITGSLTVDGTASAATPTQNGHLTTKLYVDSADTTLQNQITSNDSDITALNTATGSLQTQVTSNDSDVSALQTATGSLQTQVSSNDTDIATINTNITSLSGDAVLLAGNQTIAGNKTFSDDVTILGDLAVSGDFTLGDATTDRITTRGDLYVEDDAVFSDTISVTGVAHFAANVGIGTASPSVALDISATDAIKIPVGTTAQRPANADGLMRLNTTTNQFEGYQNSNWQGLGGVIDVDQDTYVSTEKTSDDDTLFFYTAGSERARLTSAGLFRFVDNAKATFGASDDLQIYHDGSNSYIKDAGTGSLLIQATELVLENAAGSQNYLQGVDGGAVSLYHAGSTKLATTSTGVDITGKGVFSGGITIATANELAFGDSNTRIVGSSGSDYLRFDPDGSEGMRLTATGLGIGIATPTQKLHSVASAGGRAALFVGANEWYTTKIQGSTTSGQSYGQMILAGTSSSDFALRIYNAAGSADLFAVRGDGKVGIGTATPSAQLQTTGDVIVGGNLTVSGTTFTVDTSNVLVEDPVLLLAKNQTGGAALDSGFIVERGTDTNVGFIWDESADQFAVINTTEIADDNDITIASYAAFKAGASAFTGVVTTNNLEPINGNDSGYLGSSSNKWKQVYFGILEATTANFSGTVTCHGSIDLQDNDKLLLGAGNDLEIYHDGTDSYIKDAGTGDLTVSASNNFWLRSAASPYNKWLSTADSGAITLYHSNAIKLATTSTGVTVTGALKTTTILDTNDSAGTNGQVLVSTGAAIDWKTLNEILGVDGTGTAGYLSKWADTDTIGNSPIYTDGTDVAIGSTAFGVGGTQDLSIGNPGTTTGGITLWSTTSGSHSLGFGDANSGTARYEGYVEYSHGDNSMRLATSHAERMRVTSAGSVGIGTTSPLSKFNVKGTQGNWRVDPDSVSNEIQVLSTTVANDGFRSFRLRTNETIFDTGGSERMRITSGGNFGINCTNPATRFVVQHTDGGTGIEFSMGASLSYIQCYSRSASDYKDLKIDAENLLFGTNNGTERMRITSAGNVGIGTTAPSAKLEVAGDTTITKSSGATKLRLFSGNDDPYISFGDNNTNWAVGVDRSDSGAFKISNTSGVPGTSDKITVLTDGKVGIGTNAPTKLLHVKAPASSTGSVIALFESSDSANGWLQIKGSSGNSWEIGATNTGFQFYDDETASYKVTIKNNGNVGIGTTSPGEKLEVNGNLMLRGGTNHRYKVANDSNNNWAEIGNDGASGENTLEFFTGSSSVSSMSITNGKQVLVGAADNAAGALGPFGEWNWTPLLQQLGTQGIVTVRCGADVYGGAMHLASARGSNASPTIVVNGDRAGGVYYHAYDGANFSNTPGAIECFIDGAPSADDTPGRLVFSTASDGSNSITERMVIKSDGNVGIGTNAAAALLQVETDQIIKGGIVRDGSWHRGLEITTENANYASLFFGNQQTTKYSGIVWTSSTSGNTGNKRGAQIYAHPTSATNTNLAFDTNNIVGSSSPTTKMTILGDGKVGIGTAVPGSYWASADDLVIATTGDTGMTLVAGTTSSSSAIAFADGTGSSAYRGRIEYNHNTDKLMLGAGGTTPFAIKGDGNTSLPDNSKALFGTGDDLQIYHDGSNSYIKNQIGWINMPLSQNGLSIANADFSELIATFRVNGSCDLYYDGSKKLETNSGGVTVTGTAILGGASFVDNATAYFGTGTDFRIYHDGTHSYLKQTGTGNLRCSADEFRVTNAAANETIIATHANGSVDLYYDDSKKLATNSGGVTITGQLSATTKSFLIDHPTKPGKKLRHGSLEGPENGVYIRGKGDSNIIELPEYWTKLVDEDSITVQLTPIGKHQHIYVESIKNNIVHIQSDEKRKNSNDLEYFYLILAERKDVDKLAIEE